MEHARSWASEALGPTTLGDRRRRQRAVALLDALAAAPGAALSEAFHGDWAQTLGAYRLLDNDALDLAEFSASVGQATGARIALAAPELVLLIQDSTEIRPTARQRPRDLGPLANPETRGLWLHTTLAATPDGLPLGLVHQAVWTRDPAAVPSRPQRYQTPIEGKESCKWLAGVVAAYDRLDPAQRLLVIADREADIFELYALLAARGGEFVLRAAQDRAIVEAPGRLGAATRQAPLLGEHTVTVQRHDERPARTATVALRARRVTLCPPAYASYQAARRRWWAAHPEVTPLLDGPLTPLTCTVVEVTEVAAPAGVAPLHWRLLTSLAVDTLEEAIAIADLYAVRWLIERFHYVLKHGLRLERLQLETARRWERATILYSLVAWQLLWLSQLGRVVPNVPADRVVPDAAWQALGARLSGQVPTTPPDLATFLAQLGKLGGHLGRRRDGPPGVQCLWRGLRRLHDLLALWQVLQPESAQLGSV